MTSEIASIVCTLIAAQNATERTIPMKHIHIAAPTADETGGEG